MAFFKGEFAGVEVPLVPLPVPDAEVAPVLPVELAPLVVDAAAVVVGDVPAFRAVFAAALVVFRVALAAILVVLAVVLAAVLVVLVVALAVVLAFFADAAVAEPRAGFTLLALAAVVAGAFIPLALFALAADDAGVRGVAFPCETVADFGAAGFECFGPAADTSAP